MHNEAMCLLALGWMHHPRWRLVMTGNRDEFHARPTAALAPWQDETSVIGGRDLRSGGGWAGVGASGRMAVVTNVRDPLAAQTGPSRGALVADFLRGRGDVATELFEFVFVEIGLVDDGLDDMTAGVDRHLDQAISFLSTRGELRLLTLHRGNVGHLLGDQGQHLGHLMPEGIVAHSDQCSRSAKASPCSLPNSVMTEHI